jgi:hypothetical protein
MPTETYPFNFSIIFGVVLVITLVCQAWINIINHKVSRFSIDALLIALVLRFGTKTAKRNARNFPRTKWEIIALGVLTLFAAIRLIQEMVSRLSAN